MAPLEALRLAARPPIAEPTWSEVAVATGVFVAVLGLLEALRRGAGQAVKTAEHVLAAGNRFAQQTQTVHLLRSSVRLSRAVAEELDEPR